VPIMGAAMAGHVRKLTQRQTAVLAAVERLGRANMLELARELSGAPSAIGRVLEALEERQLVGSSGDPALIYAGGVHWWATARAGEPDSDELRTLLDDLTVGHQEWEGWIERELRSVVIYLPVRDVEAELLGAAGGFRELSARIRELTAAGRVARVDIETTITAQGGVPALQVALTLPAQQGPAR
jgi:hypothetical protein